jgi:uncharacterized protein HemX
MTRGVLVSWLLILAVLCFGAGVSSGVLFAYRRQAAAQPDRAYADELKKELNLSELQYQQVCAIVQQHGADLERIYQEHQDSLRKNLQPLLKQIDKDIMDKLEPAQKSKFEGRSPNLIAK